MSKEFYEAMKIRVQAGQYKMEDMLKDLDTALGKGLIDMKEYDELKALAFESCDPTYDGNRIATSYDEGQDIEIAGNTMATLENFELIIALEEIVNGLVDEKEVVSHPAMALLGVVRSAIGDNYARMIVSGKRTFESVPKSKKQEVADKLIEMGREDLITDKDYLPQIPEEIVSEFSVTPTEEEERTIPEQ